jgi:acetyl-CoA decarbonylase/synthase complex subunit delta
MAFKRVPQKFTASIKEVTIGVGDKACSLGGENVLPLYSFDGEIKNPPKIGVEVSDLGPNRELPELGAFYAGAKTVPEVAKKACTIPGASFIALSLDSADPNGDNTPVETSVQLCKDVSDAVDLPLVIIGSKNAEKDADLLTKIAEALRGKNVLLLSAKEANYKQIAVGAVLASEQKIGAESAVDLNLAKQLNVMINQQNVALDKVVMNVGQAAAGYGFEYLISTLDRVKDAALSQNDDKLQTPIITPIASDCWNVGESSKDEKDAPEGWGPVETRGINMEVATAASLIAAGSNAVVLRHPKSVETVAKLVSSII